MSSVALLLCLAVPLLLAAALWLAPTARLALRLAPWAAAPCLALAITAPEFQFGIPWVLLGTALGLDEIRRVFLLLTAGLWTAAGVYAGGYHAHDPRRRRYFTFHLVTLAGNLGLVVALDAASFYLFFVVMSLAAYGMVAHADTAEARRAARVYIVMVLVGEAMILPGLWSAVSFAPTTALSDVALGAWRAGEWTILLLAAGFGVKAGVVPLHLWLPLAHPAAPTPASAVLSGAMIKAGVLAWIGLLPVGQAGLGYFAGLFIVAGFVNAFFGAAAGLCQKRPKTVLAYSSISQIGLVMVAIGTALLGYEAALLVAAIYCLHHGLAKAALFLGIGVVERSGRDRRWTFVLLALPALALAGAPLTSGFGAKLLLKDTTYALPGHALALEALLGLAAVGTTLIMARFLFLMVNVPRGINTAPPGMQGSWFALIAAGLALAWLPGSPGAAWASLADSGNVWSALWPLLAGMAIAIAGILAARRGHAMPAVPEGDMAVPAIRLVRRTSRIIERARRRLAAWSLSRREVARPALRRVRRIAVLRGARAEIFLMRAPIVAFNLLILIGVIVLLAAAA